MKFNTLVIFYHYDQNLNINFQLIIVYNKIINILIYPLLLIISLFILKENDNQLLLFLRSIYNLSYISL